MGVALDLARLDLEDEEAPIGMGEHDVGLAVAEASLGRGPAEPGDVLEDPVVGREGGPKPIDDELLGSLALGHARSIPHSAG